METEGKTVELEAQRRALKEKLRGLAEGPEFVQVTSELMEVEFDVLSEMFSLLENSLIVVCFVSML